MLTGMSRFLLRSGVPPFQANQPEGRRQATDLVLRDWGGPREGRGDTRVRVSAIPKDLIPISKHFVILRQAGYRIKGFLSTILAWSTFAPDSLISRRYYRRRF